MLSRSQVGNICRQQEHVSPCNIILIACLNSVSVIPAHSSLTIHCPRVGKEGLLRCLSDLAGRDLRNGTLSQESSEEQEAAGMYALSPEDFALMDRLNTEYKQRFGFPFVLCARMNDRASILRQLSECCRNGREAEVARGIGEVKKICRLRLEALVHVDRHGDAAVCLVMCFNLVYSVHVKEWCSTWFSPQRVSVAEANSQFNVTTQVI